MISTKSDAKRFAVSRPTTVMDKLRDCDYKCYPLTTYEQIVNFKLSSIERSLIDDHCVEIRSKFTLPGPLTLVAHDYKGGYLNDACIKGSQTNDEFMFYHWSLIDIFIYFSHQLITIPPIPWIKVAHLNGVEILGTLITEHASGRSFLESVLCEDDKIWNLCSSLASLMSVFAFDGWLLNIENEIEYRLVPKLVDFVKILTEECKKVKKRSKVIWYDAVTSDGKLDWQNELNNKNHLFFDHCDAIFLNYGWRTKHLMNSLDLASKKKREHDVFVGVDVFGRGCYGNGGFNTNLAISFIRKFKLSIALFAPGWVHESLDSTKFNENNYKFWNLLDLPIRHLPNERPIETSFCRGVGDRFFEFGRCVEHTRWTNHLMQQLQPNCDYGKVDHTDSFCGGSCPSFDELQLHKPILKLKCKWTGDIFVLMIYKYSTTDQTFDDSKLLVLGHTSDSVVVGRRMDSSDFSQDNELVEKMNFYKQQILNNWKVRLFCLSLELCSTGERSTEHYLEEIYLHPDLKDENTIDLKLGYLGIF